MERKPDEQSKPPSSRVEWPTLSLKEALAAGFLVLGAGIGATWTVCATAHNRDDDIARAVKEEVANQLSEIRGGLDQKKTGTP